ncbi:MAG: protein translocase subunit SecF, partial [Patescibacteria group bacterium]|nr:protein translocase subunit SecF [Patescibacteria group bacterium]
MIRFSNYRWLYAVISFFVLAPGIVSLLRFGLKPSIDFTGGSLLEISAKSLNRDMIEKVSEDASLPLVSIQQSGDTYILRIKPEGAEKTKEFLDALEKTAGMNVQLLRNEQVGPVLGRELLLKALVAAIFAIIAILLYIAYAFKNVVYGISAIIALVHDLFVVLGVFSILGAIQGVEVDTLFVTAILTTMSFSVHDTIVVFDRVREQKKRGVYSSISDITDAAITQTMSRSLA